MKRMYKSFSVILAFVMLISSVSIGLNANTIEALAATKGAISGVSNVSSGVKVTWTKDTTKTGYYIYRKAGSSTKWVKIKTVSKNSTTAWTDTNTTNGVKYSYKVYSYKGKKITSNKITKTIYRVSTPTQTVSRTSATSITVKTGTNKKASGYQIVYAANSSFRNAKSVLVSGATATKTITGLNKATKYYVKVRAYKTVSGVKYYSGYSTVKSVVTYYTAYTTNVFTSLYDIPDTSKGKKTVIRYMTKVYLFEITEKKTKGYYQKLKYNGKYYYTYTKYDTVKFTSVKNSYNYYDSSNTVYQQDLIDKAVYIFKNWDTKYVHNQSNGIKDTDGKYGFDCSGFVGYCLNETMSKYCNAYHVDKNITTLGETGIILNKGYSSEFSTSVVCTGSYDYSKLQPGDILFFDVSEGAEQADGWNHCGIYLGNKQFIHSTKGADGVEILPIADCFEEGFVKAVRFIPDENGFGEINIDTNSLGYFSMYSVANAKSEYKIGDIKKNDEIKLIYTVHTYTNNQYAYITDVTTGISGFVYYNDTRTLESMFDI